MKLRPIKWVLSPTDDHMLSMECTDIEIVDEGGGEYVEVSQSADGHGKISINTLDWIKHILNLPARKRGQAIRNTLEQQ